MKSLLSSCFFRKWLGVALVFPLATLNVVWGGVLPITSQSQEVSPVDEAVIDRAVMEATSRIRKLAAADPDEFATILHKAFGERLTPTVVRDLVQKAAHRQLPFPRRTVFVPSKVLPCAAAAYGSENAGIIFINAEFRSNSAELPDLITHEWGHHLDAILGPGDVPGDEGQIFLTGIKNSGPILASLQSGIAALENDHATIEFEGRTLTIELCPWYNPVCLVVEHIIQPVVKNVIAPAVKWTGGALQTVGKATVNIGKAIGNSIKDRVVTGFNATKNGLTTLGHTIVGVGQGIASGVTAGVGAITGSKALKDRSAELASNARQTFVKAGDSALATGKNLLDNVKSINKLFSDTKVAVNEAVPHLGTALDIMADFSPIGAAKGLASGVEEAGDAISKGESFANIMKASSGLLLAGAGKGLGTAWKLKKASDAGNKLKNVAGLAELNKLQSLKGLEPSNWKKFQTLVKDNKANLIKLKKGISTGNDIKQSIEKVKAAADADAQAASNAAAKAKAAADAEAAKAKFLADALAAARLKAAADVQAAAKAGGATDAQLAATAKVQADAAKTKAAADAKAQADAKALAKAAMKADADAKAQADAATKRQADADAKLRADVAKLSADADAKAKADAAAKVQADAEAKAALAARTQAETDAKAKFDASAKTKVDMEAKAEADAAAKAQADAYAKAKSDAAKAQLAADAKAEAVADAKLRADAQAAAAKKAAADATIKADADAKTQAIADAKALADAQAASLTRTAAEPDDYESRARAAWKAKRAAYDAKEAAAAPVREKAAGADATTDAEPTEADAPEER